MLVCHLGHGRQTRGFALPDLISNAAFVLGAPTCRLGEEEEDLCVYCWSPDEVSTAREGEASAGEMIQEETERKTLGGKDFRKETEKESGR